MVASASFSYDSTPFSAHGQMFFKNIVPGGFCSNSHNPHLQAWAKTKAMGILMSYLLPGFSNINDASISAMAKTNYTLMLIGVVFLVPLAEEMLYRGLIFRNLWQSSKAAAYLLSMAAFAAVHTIVDVLAVEKLI